MLGLCAPSCVSPTSEQADAARFLVLDTFEVAAGSARLPAGWRLDVGYAGWLSTQAGKDGQGKGLLIDGRAGTVGLCRFFEPQTGTFSVELDVATISPPRGLVSICLGGDVWVEAFDQWSVCLNYDYDSAAGKAGPFRVHSDGWQRTRVTPAPSRWYHVRYVVDVSRQCFDLWLDGECVAAAAPFRSPATAVSCLMVYTLGREKQSADAVVIDNVTVYPRAVRPPAGAPVMSGALPRPPASATAGAPTDAAAAKPGYRLTFQDEFDGDALDLTRWNYGRTPKDAVADPQRIRELYPCTVRDGVLKLRIEKRRKTCEITPGDVTGYSAKALETYTAPGIATWDTFQQAYGWFEIRCKMPQAFGVWTGFWLLPPRRCEGGAEIDIFESLTRWNDRISFALHPHWKDGVEFGHAGIWVPGLAEGFHVYALQWEPDRLTLTVDGVPVDEFSGKGVPSAATYMIVSCRTGGWAGDVVDEAALPDGFVVDYVRVYQKE